MSEKYFDIIQDEKPTLVDFYADWCGPCKMLAPILENVKKELGNQIRILKINVDTNTQLSAQLNVRGVPTLILYKNGNVMWRESGVIPQPDLLKMIQPHIN